MARTYWITFRIEHDNGYDQRYDELIDSLKSHINGKYWDQTTSFIIFSSNSTVDQVASSIELAIDLVDDIAVLGCTHFKTMKVIGNYKDGDIFSLVDFADKL